MSENYKAQILAELVQEVESNLAALRDQAKGKELLLRELKAKFLELSSTTSNGRPQPRRENQGDSLAGHIAELLKQRGQPMRGTDIAKALQEAGVTTTAKGGMLAMVLSVLRKRENLFSKVSRGVYGLKERK